MSAWAALNNSCLAMTTQSACLEVISQNISNVNTTGYKKADMEFATLLTDEKASADIFAVQPWQRQSVDRAGPTQSTGRWSDLAISGPGMFVLNSKVDGSGDMVFTRNGGFGTKALDANGDGTSETYLVDSHGNYLQGWKANADGQLSPTNSTASLSSVYYEPGQDIPGQATKTVTIQANVDSNSNKTEKLSVPIYDQSLKTQSMTMSWDRTGENAWNLKLLATEGTITNLPDGVPVQFDGTAQVVSPKSFDATIAWKDGTSSTVTINLSNTTQYGGYTHLQNTIQDGRATDTWTRSEFDGYGVMSGVSALGRERALFQVAVANFNSPNLLEAQNGTNFTMTRAAGTMTLNTVTNRVGQPSFVAGAVEASNVDLGEEFTKMITTQKAYNTASQVFKTSDEMLKTATQMK